MKNINFSVHAFKRVAQRLSLSPFEVRHLIGRKTINIGAESKSNREHLLFYSERDKDCFVLIYDSKCRHIVTVLPIEYHNICAWRVTDEAQQQARDMFKKHTNGGKSFITGDNQNRVHHLYAVLRNTEQRYGVGSVLHTSYGSDLTEVVKNPHFLQRVKDTIIKKCENSGMPINDIYAVEVRQSKKSPPDVYRINGFNREKFTMSKILGENKNERMGK